MIKDTPLPGLPRYVLLYAHQGFVTINMHMVSASQRRSCCRLSNIFDGCLY